MKWRSFKVEKRPKKLRHFFMSKNRKKGLRTMSKLFMYGTSLEGIEQLMVMVPNFQPRRSGIVINNYFNCQGGDENCNGNVINVNNRWHKCGYIGSDFKINVDRCNINFKFSKNLYHKS